MAFDIGVVGLFQLACLELLNRLGDRESFRRVSFRSGRAGRSGVDLYSARLERSESLWAYVACNHSFDAEVDDVLASLDTRALGSVEVLTVVARGELAGLRIDNNKKPSPAKPGIHLRIQSLPL